ncbi:MAG: glycosyltransferase family 4 protein [Dehalococcoidales bacterium]
MKIALVSPYDFAHPGGVVNHICALGYRLTEMGQEVRYIAPASRNVDSFDERLITVGKARPIPASGSIARVSISPMLSTRITEILEREKFDIIHLHEPLMPMMCTTVLRMSGTANVGTFHAFDGKGYYVAKPLSPFFFKRWFSKLDGKIAVSRPAMEFVSKHYPAEYSIIPNGIDTGHFHPGVKPVEEYLDGKMNILFVGRLEPRKGADYLLKAYQRVKREIPETRLIIVGPGTNLRYRYERMVKRKGIKDVVFVGYSSYTELPRYYKTADVYCAPATGWESFGIVLLEAMAVGTPVVASNIAGYASILGDGEEGILVPPKDDEQLARSLVYLLRNDSLREEMGVKGIRKASGYDWKKVSRSVLGYYNKVLGSKPASREPFSLRKMIMESVTGPFARGRGRNGKTDRSP